MSKKSEDQAKIINKINGPYELIAYLFTFRPKTTAFVIFLLIEGFVAWLVFSGTTPEKVKEKVKDKIGIIETINKNKEYDQKENKLFCLIGYRRDGYVFHFNNRG